MEYTKIVAVTGLPGLYELVSSKSDGAIVRSLDDKSTRFVSSRIHSMSHLESIEIYTIRENVNLVEIFYAMEKSGEKLPDEKDANAVKKYMEKIYPGIDFGRVYNSDLKKMVKWFDVLRSNNIEIKLTEPVVEEEAPVIEEKKKEKKQEKPEVKTAPKKEAKKKEAKAEKEEPKKPARVASSKTTKAKVKKEEKNKPTKEKAKTPTKKSAKKK